VLGHVFGRVTAKAPIELGDSRPLIEDGLQIGGKIIGRFSGFEGALLWLQWPRRPQNGL
jgi:hypothetical protein